MKLLFNANLSPKLVSRLAELFPGSIHVFNTGMARHCPDRSIWEFARQNGFAIVTADSDFLELAYALGAPPASVHVENCNYRTQRVQELLQRNAIKIADLERSSVAVLTLREQ